MLVEKVLYLDRPTHIVFILVEVSGIIDLPPNFVKVLPSSMIPLQLTADVEKEK